MKEVLTKSGLWQSVKDSQISEAKQKAVELNNLLINDYYKGRLIEKVEYRCDLPKEVSEELETSQAVFFKLQSSKSYSNNEKQFLQL